MNSIILINRLDRPLVIAHRGASRACHENTLEAFEEALRIGADAIECDIRRTGDSVLVVHHNARVKKSYRRIARTDYEQVQRFARKQRYEVPTLDEAVRLCAGRIGMDIELKEPGYEREVVDIVKHHGMLDRALFKSFYDEIVLAVKEAEPSATTGLLIGVASQSVRNRLLKSVAGRMQECRADFVAPNWKLVTPTFVARMTEHGWPILVWTVNRKAQARRLVRLGVDGLIGDVPERLFAGIHEAQAGEPA